MGNSEIGISKDVAELVSGLNVEAIRRYGYWGGGRSKKTYLLIESVALGNVKNLVKPKSGFDSVMGCNGAQLINNEFIVYDTAKVRLDYLVEVKAR